MIKCSCDGYLSFRKGLSDAILCSKTSLLSGNVVLVMKKMDDDRIGAFDETVATNIYASLKLSIKDK